MTLFEYLLAKGITIIQYNSVSYLINTNCICNILVIVLKEYNNKIPDQYLRKIISDIIANQKFDNSKDLVT